MFQNLLMTAIVNISTIRSIIKTNDRVRELLFGAGYLPKLECHEDTELILKQLTQDIPGLNDWRIYDHCAVVTRLYAIYESFVEDLIRDWLILLPELFPNYTDLEKTTRKTHQSGVGRLLQELLKEDNNRYKNLSIQKVMHGLFNGESGGDKYELLPDAFLFHEQNLRKDTLEKLLANAGIPNTWSWIIKHRYVKYFLEEIRGGENTADKELEVLISYRNDAAHASLIDDVLDSNALLQSCDFIETLCQALAELITYQVIEKKKIIGQSQEIGLITEWFKTPKAGILVTDGEYFLSVGGSFFLVGQSYCQLARIESIRINDVPTDNVQTKQGMEVGLKFDVDARKDLRLCQL